MPLSPPEKSPADVLVPWYYGRPFVWIMILTFGPFALPLLILSPCFGRLSKLLISLVLLLMFGGLWWIHMAMIDLIAQPESLYQSLGGILPEAIIDNYVSLLKLLRTMLSFFT